MKKCIPLLMSMICLLCGCSYKKDLYTQDALSIVNAYYQDQYGKKPDIAEITIVSGDGGAGQSYSKIALVELKDGTGIFIDWSLGPEALEIYEYQESWTEKFHDENYEKADYSKYYPK